MTPPIHKALFANVGTAERGVGCYRFALALVIDRRVR